MVVDEVGNIPGADYGKEGIQKFIVKARCLRNWWCPTAGSLTSPHHLRRSAGRSPERDVLR
jgi:hypothetical protein